MLPFATQEEKGREHEASITVLTKLDSGDLTNKSKRELKLPKELLKLKTIKYIKNDFYMPFQIQHAQLPSIYSQSFRLFLCRTMFSYTVSTDQIRTMQYSCIYYRGHFKNNLKKKLYSHRNNQILTTCYMFGASHYVTFKIKNTIALDVCRQSYKKHSYTSASGSILILYISI